MFCRVFFLLICSTAVTLWPNPTIQAMVTNTWNEIPNSKMADVCACTHGFPDVCGQSHCNGLLVWSGGTFDTYRNNLIVWGGGHNAYLGNEVYIFNIDTLKWTRITDPSPPVELYAPNCIDPLPDGNPNSRHTWDGLCYIVHSDRMFAAGGSLACGPSSGTTLVWTFDFVQNKWQNMNPTFTNFSPSTETETYFLRHGTCDYDSVTKNVYFESAYGFYAYNYDANTWTKLYNVANAGRHYGEKNGVLDPKRRLFIVAGKSDTVWAYFIDKNPVVLEKWNTIGASGIVNYAGPGLEYDPTDETIVGWANGDVYRLNPDTKTWTPSNAVWGSGSGHVFGRFAYIPSENAFVAMMDVDVNVHIYKNNAGSMIHQHEGKEKGKLNIHVHPNPFNAAVIISISDVVETDFKNSGPQSIRTPPLPMTIYDINGRLVTEIAHHPDNHTIWHASDLPPSIYILKTRIGNRTINKKLLKVQ